MKTKITLTIAFIFTLFFHFGQVPTSGLVARYDFSSTSDFYNDGSSSNYDLCGSGTVTVVEGLTAGDSAALFNGSSYAYYCGADGSAYNSSSASFSAWFKLDQFNAYSTIAVMRYDVTSSPYNSMNLFTGSGSNYKIACAVTNGVQLDYVLSGTTSIQLGQWYHAVCTYDELSGDTKLYLNGTLEAATTLTPSSIIYSNSSFTIGHIPTGAGANGFVGTIDEVLYYNRAITAEEVCEIHTNANCNLSVPNAPTDLTASVNASNNVELAWLDNSNDEIAFTIERSSDLGNNYSPIASVGSNTTTYQDLTTTAATTYMYRVYAYNVNGNSNESNAVLVTTGTVGISENLGEQVVISPNPSNGNFTVQLPEGFENAVYSIETMNGTLVTSGLMSNFIKPTFAKGVYLLRLNYNGNQLVNRIVIQ